MDKDLEEGAGHTVRKDSLDKLLKRVSRPKEYGIYPPRFEPVNTCLEPYRHTSLLVETAGKLEQTQYWLHALDRTH
jgi:hypothetical protein